MNMRKIVYILLAFSLQFSTVSLAQNIDIKSIVSEYEVGHFQFVIETINKNMPSYKLLERVQAYRLLTLSYLAEDQISEAEEAVKQLLALEPNYTVSWNDTERFRILLIKARSGIATITTASQQAEAIEEVPVPFTLITEEMIQAIGARTLRDALVAYVPGITMIEGEEANISMRGVYSYSQENVLIMLNGHRLNSYCTNSVAPDFRISMDNIKQIEVLRGAASSLYGNVALTAVVNIITKNGGDVDGLKATFGMGSNDTYKGNILFGKRNMDTDILLWASIYSSQGYKHFIGKDSPDFYGDTPKDGFIYVDGYNHKPAYDLGLTYNWNKFKVLLSHQYSKRVYAYNNIYVLSTYNYDKYGAMNGVKPGRGNSLTSGNIQYNTNLKNTEIEASFSIDYEDGGVYNVLGDTLSPIYSNVGNLFYPQGEYIQDSIHIIRGAFQTQNWKDLAIGGGLKVFQKYNWGKSHGNVLLGTRYEYYNMFYNDFSIGDNYKRVIISTVNERNKTFSNGVENSFSFFAQAKHYFNSQFIFNGGFRYDFKNRYNKKKMNVFSPRLSLIYLPKDYWNIKLSYSRSFVDAPFFYRVSTLVYPGSEDLDPQYMDNLQLSSTVNIKPAHLVYDFNLYYNHVSDIIFLTTNKYTNSGKLNMLGWENSITYKIPHFYLHGNLTYQHVLNVENYAATGNKIHAVPNFMLHLVAEKELNPVAKNLWVNAQLSYYAEQLAPITNLFVNKNSSEIYSDPDYKIPGCCLVDLGLRYSWRSIDANVRCYNLFNTKYRLGGDRVPVLQAGRSILATVSFRLK